VTVTAERGFQLSTDTPGMLGVNGVLSFETAASALQAIRTALAGRKLGQLDLAGVRHSDSAGLACVLAIVAAADRDGRALQVIHMPAGMQTLARVCEVEQLLF
jgi:phospholipid transport system transporter-binding protein